MWDRIPTFVQQKRQSRKAPPISSSSANFTQKSQGSGATNIKKSGHHRRSSAMAMPLSSSIPENCATPSPTSRQPTNSHNSSTWKVKLGSLLKKNSTTVSRQASLRRCQSEDSLASGRSTELMQTSVTRRALNFSHASLLQAVSNEDSSSLSDRGKPEPQVPHSALDGNGEDMKSKSTRAKQARPSGGVYSEESLEALDREAAGSTPRNLQSFDKDEDGGQQRSSSPFDGLGPNFPGVMGEVGLDFDPLSYKPAHGEAQKATRILSERKPRSAPPKEPTVSVRRVESVQSLRGEAVFAAVSTTKTHHNAAPQQRTAHNAENGLNGSSELDRITADDCTSPPKAAQQQKTGFPLSRKKSAAEQLGVGQHWAAKRGFATHQLTVNNNNNGKPCLTVPNHPEPVVDLHSGQTPSERSVDVEYYTVPQNKLEKKPYYGSFVALVGKISDAQFHDKPGGFEQSNAHAYPSAPHSRDHPHAFNIPQDSSNHGGRLQSSQSLRSRSAVDHSPPDRSSHSRGFPGQHAQIISPRLDTFDPAGRCRRGYVEPSGAAPGRRDCKYTVPLSEYENMAKSPHSRSRSVDSHTRQHQSSVTRETSDACRSVDPTAPKYYPIPAPRKHYRSFSAGDHLDPQQCYYKPRKPVPLPRTKRLASEPCFGADGDPFHRPMAYSNMTYEYVGELPPKYPSASYSYNLVGQDRHHSARDQACGAQNPRGGVYEPYGCLTGANETSDPYRSSTSTHRHPAGLSWV